ncbi:hypothetical protein D3C71_1259620 [compost metagenome]
MGRHRKDHRRHQPRDRGRDRDDSTRRPRRYRQCDCRRAARPGCLEEHAACRARGHHGPGSRTAARALGAHRPRDRARAGQVVRGSLLRSAARRSPARMGRQRRLAPLWPHRSHGPAIALPGAQGADRRGRRLCALERACRLADAQDRCIAGRRLRADSQAGRRNACGRLPYRAGPGGRGSAAGRAQCALRRPGGNLPDPGGEPERAPADLHRLGASGPASGPDGGQAPAALPARAGRSRAGDCLRRRRPGGCGAAGRQGQGQQHRTDLRLTDPVSGRGPHLRSLRAGVHRAGRPDRRRRRPGSGQRHRSADQCQTPAGRGTPGG